LYFRKAYQDPLIITSLRNIILQILNTFIDDECFNAYVTDLPLVQFFGNLALRLRQAWLTLDRDIMRGYSAQNRDLIMIVRKTMSQVEDLRDELGFYGDIIGMSASAKTEGGRKV